jgi:hypothetical protein
MDWVAQSISYIYAGSPYGAHQDDDGIFSDMRIMFFTL